MGNLRGWDKTYHILGRKKSIAALRGTVLSGAILVRGENARFVPENRGRNGLHDALEMFWGLYRQQELRAGRFRFAFDVTWIAHG
jgi:hypothetical protein